ncbi:class I SAM-dependent methyltransferase, partial [Chloroflexota bacterium]
CGRSGKNWVMEHGKDYAICRCSYCKGDFTKAALSVDYKQEYKTEGFTIQDGRKLKTLSQPGRELREANMFANFRQALKFLKTFSSDNKLLDVGCGIGVFPKVVEQLGLEVYALDPATEAIKYARENFGLKNTMDGTIADIPPDWQQFDFISCFEVLEHLEQPREVAKKIYQLLAPGGYFIMSVPNRDRLSVTLGRRDKYDFPPNHLTRWSKEVVDFFLTSIGFTNVVLKIDGMNRWTLGNILLPSRFNQKIIRRKLTGLLTTDQTKREFFLYNQLWRFTLVVGDVAASVLEAIVGKRYGVWLIAFAQKPR